MAKQPPEPMTLPSDRWETARVGLTLKPGQKGTKKLQRQYGEQLVRLRYRYDDLRLKRYRTVELMLDESDWAPPPGPPGGDPVAFVRVIWGEVVLAKKLRRAGARWYPRCGLWAVPISKIEELGLEERVVGPGPQCPRRSNPPRDNKSKRPPPNFRPPPFNLHCG